MPDRMDAIGAAMNGMRSSIAAMGTAAAKIAGAGLPQQNASADLSLLSQADPGGTSTDDLSIEIPNLMIGAQLVAANVAVMATAQSAYQSIVDMGAHLG
jgi:hypothetical protein